MKRNILSGILLILLFSSVFASDDSCVYNTGGTTWHCSNNSPGISITPGTKGNLTFYCCYTAPGATGEEEYALHVEEKTVSRRQIQIDDEWIIEETEIPGTQFLTDVYYPTTVGPNQDIEIIMSFDLPAESEYYAPGEVLHAIIHLLLNPGGSFISNNVIDARIVIPDDWSPSLIVQIRNFISEYYLFISGGILILILSGMWVKNYSQTDKAKEAKKKKLQEKIKKLKEELDE